MCYPPWNARAFLSTKIAISSPTPLSGQISQFCSATANYSDSFTRRRPLSQEGSGGGGEGSNRDSERLITSWRGEYIFEGNKHLSSSVPLTHARPRGPNHNNGRIKIGQWQWYIFYERERGARLIFGSRGFSHFCVKTFSRSNELGRATVALRACHAIVSPKPLFEEGVTMYSHCIHEIV